MPRLIACRNCTEPDCTYCNLNILAVALERGYFNSLIGEQHTVRIDSELVSVRHGHWIGKEDQKWHCSECDGIAPKGYRYNYCPDCGAKMDEETTNE